MAFSLSIFIFYTHEFSFCMSEIVFEVEAINSEKSVNWSLIMGGRQLFYHVTICKKKKRVEQMSKCYWKSVFKTSVGWVA